jgi:hypothetical protein
LGAACERDVDCQAGTLRPYCIPAAEPGVTDDTGWTNGYCTGRDCGPGDCGPNGICLGINGMGQTVCFALCEPGRSECRMGYVCENIGRRDISVCVPSF